MRERESLRSHADFLCSRTKPDAHSRIYAALPQRECPHLKCVSPLLKCACARSNFVLCTRTSLRALALDINYFHTWIKHQKLSTNQIFLWLTWWKYWAYVKRELILEFLYNLILSSHIKCILEMARNRVLGWFIKKEKKKKLACLIVWSNPSGQFI